MVINTEYCITEVNVLSIADGIVKRWDYDTRKLNCNYTNAHQGWVTDFLYW